MHQSQVNVLPKRSAKMIEGTEKPKIPLKFAKRAARYNEFGYNRPIIAHAQILVHRWGPRTRILVLFLRQTQPEFSFVCGAG